MPGLYAAGDMACVPHNYLLGALTYGKICARARARLLPARRRTTEPAASDERSRSHAERARVLAPLLAPDGIPHHQYRVQGPPLGQRLPAAAQDRQPHGDRPRALHARARRARARSGAREPHDLMRVMRRPLHPRLRRDGGARLAVPHARAAGASTTTARISRSSTTSTGSSTSTCSKERGRIDAGVQAPGRRYVVPLDERELRSYHDIRVPARGRGAAHHALARRSCRHERARRSRAHQGGRPRAPSGNAQTAQRFDVPVVVDESQCITGCRICIDSCPVDCLAVNPATAQGAHDVRRVLVLPGVRDRLPEGRHHREDSLPASVEPMTTPRPPSRRD